MERTIPRLSAAQIKAEALRLGFSACGLAPAAPANARHAAFFRQWLAQGRQAGMDYMARHEDLRLDPRLLMESCRTVVSVILNYRPATPIPPDRLQIAWYAYGQDYHDVVRAKLQALLQALQQDFPDGTLQGRACCDTAPVLERYWAWRCGLGWIGRHTQLVVPHAGSAFFIGELLLNFPADTYDSPIASGGTGYSDSFATLCGTCTRCVDACPTHALSAGGLDARRCLSYLTIENRGPIPEEAAQEMYPYLYGCDRCLQACPHLRHAVPAQEPAFTPRPELLQMTKEDWRHLSVEQYRRLFKGSAVKRAKYEGLVRNLTALGLTCPPPENPQSPDS